MKIVLNSIITVSTTFIGFLLSHFFLQPSIDYYNDGYCQKFDSMSFGTIYLINNGRGEDENIAITFGMEIPEENIDVSYLTSPYQIAYLNHRTIFKIDKLNPGEAAEITFKTVTQMDNFVLESFTSKSGNITEVSDVLLPWWHLSSFQIQFLIALIVLSTSLGFYFGKKRSKVVPKKVRSSKKQLTKEIANKIQTEHKNPL